MGLNLRPLGKKIWETLTPQNEAAIRAGQQSIQAANQNIQQNATHGVLADPQARQSFMQSQQPEPFNMGQAAGSTLKDFGTGLGLRGLRTATGLGQSMSGIYDLVTPGTGTNRFSQGMDRFAQQLDQTAQEQGPSVAMAYKTTAPAVDLATFAAPSAAVKIASKLPKVARVAEAARSVVRAIDNATGKAADALAARGAGGRIAGAGVRNLTVGNTGNIVANTGLDLGQETSKGRDISVQDLALSAGLNTGIGVGLPVATQGVIEGARLAKPAAQATATAAKQGVQTVQRATQNPAIRALDDQYTQLNQRWQSASPQGRKQIEQAIQANRAERTRISEGGYVGTGGTRSPESPAPDQSPVSKPVVTAKTNTPENISSKPSVTEKTEVKLNTGRLDVNDEAKARLDTDTTEIIDRLSNDEVKRLAKSAGMDTKTYDVGQTKKKIAEQLNVRRDVVRLQNEADAARQSGDLDRAAELLRQSAEMGRTSRSQGTDIARQLQARRIIANELDTPQQKVFKLLDNAGVNPDAYTRRFAGVDFKNADDVMRAYREMVPAKFSDWLDKYRYTNMLSSPLTHIVNITSNVGGIAGIAPAQKFTEGVIDAARSAVTGGPRTRFASEAGSYYKGVAQSVPDAIKAFGDVLTGKQNVDLPDADALKNGKLAYGGAKGAADAVLSIIPKFLEASDQFGMTLARGGEKAALNSRVAKGVKLKGDVDAMTDAAAKYRVFRQNLGEPGQGPILDAIDFIPQQIMKARNSKNPVVSTISKFTLPFVTTPTNLFKQGIEYSPLGITTIGGNADKTAQFAKMTMGTTVTGLAAGAFAAKDAITFAEPTDAKQRDAFRAEGKQPYAVKIGDKWISYSKLHPAIAFNFATVAAVKDAIDKGSIDESEGDKILRSAAGVVGFFRDQSYMKAVGDFTSNLQLKDGAQAEDAFAAMASNYANQLSPFKSMVSWIGRQVDPTQRKIDYSGSAPEQIWQNIVKDIPGLNESVPTRNNPYNGQPLQSDNPELNSFSPLRVTNDKGFGNTTGLNIDQREMMRDMPEGQRGDFRQGVINDKYDNKLATQEQEQFKKEKSGDVKQLSNGKFFAKVGDEFRTFDNENEAKTAVAKEDFKRSGETIKQVGDNVFRRTKDGDVQVTSKLKYDYDLGQNKLQSAKRKDNLGEWLKLANGQLQNLDKQLQDPTLDDLEKSDIQEKIDTLMESAAKYQGYGGFSKGKGSKGKSVGSAYKYAVSSNAGGESVKPRVTARQVGGVRSKAQRRGKPSVSLKRSTA